MATMYPESYMKKRETTIVLGIVVGILSAMAFLFAGKLVGDDFLTDLGILVAAGALVLVLVNLWLAKRTCFCDGNVLEVRDGKVLAHIKEAFCYNPRTLAGSVFVPFCQDDVIVEKTLHLPVSGKILSCVLRCEGRVVNFQRHYDAFLSPGKKESLDLHQVVRTCIATFLQQNRERIASQLDVLERSGDGVEVIPEVMKDEAEKYLRKELSSTGFVIYSANPSCSLKPLIVA